MNKRLKIFIIIFLFVFALFFAQNKSFASFNQTFIQNSAKYVQIEQNRSNKENYLQAQSFLTTRQNQQFLSNIARNSQIGSNSGFNNYKFNLNLNSSIKISSFQAKLPMFSPSLENEIQTRAP